MAKLILTDDFKKALNSNASIHLSSFRPDTSTSKANTPIIYIPALEYTENTAKTLLGLYEFRYIKECHYTSADPTKLLLYAVGFDEPVGYIELEGETSVIFKIYITVSKELSLNFQLSKSFDATMTDYSTNTLSGEHYLITETRDNISNITKLNKLNIIPNKTQTTNFADNALVAVHSNDKYSPQLIVSVNGSNNDTPLFNEVAISYTDGSFKISPTDANNITYFEFFSNNQNSVEGPGFGISNKDISVKQNSVSVDICTNKASYVKSKTFSLNASNVTADTTSAFILNSNNITALSSKNINVIASNNVSAVSNNNYISLIGTNNVSSRKSSSNGITTVIGTDTATLYKCNQNVLIGTNDLYCSGNGNFIFGHDNEYGPMFAIGNGYYTGDGSDYDSFAKMKTSACLNYGNGIRFNSFAAGSGNISGTDTNYIMVNRHAHDVNEGPGECSYPCYITPTFIAFTKKKQNALYKINYSDLYDLIKDSEKSPYKLDDETKTKINEQIEYINTMYENNRTFVLSLSSDFNTDNIFSQIKNKNTYKVNAESLGIITVYIKNVNKNNAITYLDTKKTINATETKRLIFNNGTLT